MKTFKNLVPSIHINIIDRELVLVFASAAAIALAFGTLVTMLVSRL